MKVAATSVRLPHLTKQDQWRKPMLEMVAKQVTSYPAKGMNIKQKKAVALQALRQAQMITSIAKENNISRKFVYQQKDKAIQAIDGVFKEPETGKEKILFYLPVTKSWLIQLVICLLLHCRSSFRGVTKLFQDILDSSISIATIHDISINAIKKAQSINGAQDLSGVKLGAHDELFHNNQPVLVGIDITSLYCYLLSQEKQRDGDTWAINLWDLATRGFNPERVIADDGYGLRAGHQIALPHIPCDADNFHITKALIELRQYFRNCLKTAISYRKQLEHKMGKAKELGRHQKYSHKLGFARKHEVEMQYLSTTINILVSWMEHDILNKAGPSPTTRYELFDFVVSEFKKLEKIHPHRIRSVRITLRNQRNLLLAFSEVLDNKFEKIAEQFACSLGTVWKICELQRCDDESTNYIIRSVPFKLQFEEEFEQIEDAVVAAMDSTERTSSMVENLNSRLSPYFFLRRVIGYGYLDLLRFYLNHTPFLRSEKQHRVNRTPTEILTGKVHNNWLEMLGFERFKLAA